jgi:hypothetical protein
LTVSPKTCLLFNSGCRVDAAIAVTSTMMPGGVSATRRQKCSASIAGSDDDCNCVISLALVPNGKRHLTSSCGDIKVSSPSNTKRHGAFPFACWNQSVISSFTLSTLRSESKRATSMQISSFCISFGSRPFEDLLTRQQRGVCLHTRRDPLSQARPSGAFTPYQQKRPTGHQIL